MVIVSNLDQDQDEKLLKLHGDNKETIGWTTGDINGIHPTIVSQRIHLEGNARPYQYLQRRLNLTLQEVVMKEELK